VRRAAAALLPLLLAVACGPTAPPSPRVERPNILIIALDRVGTDLGAYGSEAETPHIDRLAARGRRFDRAFAQYPSLVPSRLAILTGRRPEKTRLWDELESRDGLGGALPLQEAFRAQGYFTARVGRLVGGTSDAPFVWDRADEPGPDVVGRRALEVLAERPDRPFFLAVSFEAGDPRRLPPAEFLEAYDPRRVRLPAVHDLGQLPPLALADAGSPRAESPLLPEDQRRRLRVAALARVTQVDTQVGALLDALDRGGLTSRTLVVVVGDTAPDLGVPRSALLLEDALRASLIVTGPGVGSGRASEEVVELVDLYPTLALLGSLPGVAGLDGRSLLPLLENPQGSGTGTAFSATRRAAGTLGRSVRDSRYRYTEWPDGSRELFDHEVDPGESTNLAAVPGHEAALAEMKGLLDAGPRAAALGVPRTSALADADSDASGPRPNVLLVMVDDLLPRLGCYGAGATPNLDRLAREGRRFDRAYCQVSSCSPSRTSLLTGRRPEGTGLFDNLQSPREHLGNAVPLQEHFHAQGYFTARVGKIYHGPFEEQFAWDLAEHTPYLPEDEANEPPPRRERLAAGGPSLAWTATANDDANEPDGRTARRVVRLLEEHQDRPFFIAAGFNKPHIPWVAPRPYFDRNPSDQIVLAPEPDDDWADVPEIAVSRRAPRLPGLLLSARPEPRDDTLRRQAMAAYDACVSFVDAQVGLLMEALDRLKLRERTIVVVISDHGYHLGDHGGLWRKNTLFEASLRVPLILSVPGMADPGGAASGLVESVDVYPTLVELARVPSPPGLEGTSLVPLLEDAKRAVKKAAFSVAPRSPPELGRTVRTPRWRYTLWPDGGEELYDLAPSLWARFRASLRGQERRAENVAGDPALGEQKAEMRRLFDALDAR